jgi:6-phospho-beta-glucosidase
MPKMLPGDEEILAAGVPNFLAVNWYCTTVVDTSDAGGEGGVLNIGAAFRARNPYLDYTEWGWSYDPSGLHIALHECWARFRKPIMICENGWSERERLEDGAVHDPYRVEYFRNHIVAMRDAIRDGVDLRGFYAWGPLDIVSCSSSEMEKRYGFIYVDLDTHGQGTGERIKKDSFAWYRQVIDSNGAVL